MIAVSRSDTNTGELGGSPIDRLRYHIATGLIIICTAPFRRA